jgi:hypothetical protein
VARSAEARAEKAAAQVAKAAGWGTFAAVLFLLLGVFNLIDGIAALAGDRRFAEDELFAGDLSMWGAILLFVGVLQVFVSALIFRRSPMGQVGGLLLAGFSLVVHFFILGVYPVWSVISMATAALVIYALLVYGDEFG